MCINSVFVFSQRVSVEDVNNKSLLPEIPLQYKMIEHVWDINKLSDPWIPQDDDGDGSIDSARIIRNSNYRKIQEVMDTDDDGYIDDFAYFNEAGQIEYQEIDTNGDQNIDYWVEIYKGERILRIQRDLDFDGYIDRDYNFKNQ